MNEQKKVSNAVVNRLPRYYRYIEQLVEKKIKRISSQELSEIMGLTASQIRQDFNKFGEFGQQGYGYQVEHLHKELKKILGLSKNYHMIIIGAGKIGQALSNYTFFNQKGFIVHALFDIDEQITASTVYGKKIYHINQLKQYCENEMVDIAVLTVPGVAVNEIVPILKDTNIKTIWNFANRDLKIENKIIENVHLIDSLLTLSFKINQDSIKNN